jgi:hypothetical protein
LIARTYSTRSWRIKSCSFVLGGDDRFTGPFSAIKLRYEALSPVLDERGRRRFAAAEALAAGWGGIAAVCEATGIARSTIGYGLRELRGQAPDSALGGIRRKGAGRKPLTETDPTLLSDLEDLVDPATRGDPMSPLKWISKSLRNLAGALCAMGHRVGHDVVGTLLKRLGYSLQANRKTIEGSGPVDRDAQFQHIAETVRPPSPPTSLRVNIGRPDHSSKSRSTTSSIPSLVAPRP